MKNFPPRNNGNFIIILTNLIAVFSVFRLGDGSGKLNPIIFFSSNSNRDLRFISNVTDIFWLFVVGEKCVQFMESDLHFPLLSGTKFLEPNLLPLLFHQ